MAEEFVLIDINVLIRWAQREAPSFRIVGTAIKQLMRSRVEPCYTSQNLGEFWNVLTRPVDRNGFGFTPATADVRAKAIEAAFRLLPDGPAVHDEWRRLLVDYSISGIQVHDARLVAAMRVHGVKRILTFNTRDFARFTDIEAIHPADLAK
ncbi:MAG TPA: PIN domain-containing protein [Terracidiphilus sp.]|jgi:predicted nucleic acid-binding protein